MSLLIKLSHKAAMLRLAVSIIAMLCSGVTFACYCNTSGDVEGAADCSTQYVCSFSTRDNGSGCSGQTKNSDGDSGYYCLVQHYS